MELETSERLEQEWNVRIEELNRLLEQERAEETAQMRQSEEVHLKFASLEQQNTFILENMNRVEEEIAKFAEELKELDQNKGNASEEIREKEDQIEELRQTIEDSKELFTEIQEEIKLQSTKRDELNQNIKHS